MEMQNDALREDPSGQPEPVKPARKKSSTKNIALIGGLGLLCLIIIAAIFGGRSPRKPAAGRPLDTARVVAETTAVAGKSPVAEELNSPPAGDKKIAANGIGKSRRAMMAAFGDVKFSKGDPVRGEDNFYANKGSIGIQLLGPEENLSAASIMITIERGREKDAGTLLAAFANEFDADIRPWFGDLLSNASATAPSIDESKDFSDHRARFQIRGLGEGVYIATLTIKAK